MPKFRAWWKRRSREICEARTSRRQSLPGARIFSGCDARLMNKRELRRARIQKKRTAVPEMPSPEPAPERVPTAFPKAAHRFLRVITSIPFWCLVAASWGATSAWLYRDWMNPDGMSYMDLADSALQHGPVTLVNAH